MFFTTVSPKYQATLGLAVREKLGLKPGVRIKGTIEDGKIVLEPLGDILDSFGIFKDAARVPSPSIAEETEAAELAMAEDAMKSMRAD